MRKHKEELRVCSVGGLSKLDLNQQYLDKVCHLNNEDDQDVQLLDQPDGFYSDDCSKEKKGVMQRSFIRN